MYLFISVSLSQNQVWSNLSGGKNKGFNKNEMFFLSHLRIQTETVKICLAAPGSYIASPLCFIYGLYFQGHSLVIMLHSNKQRKGREGRSNCPLLPLEVPVLCLRFVSQNLVHAQLLYVAARDAENIIVFCFSWVDCCSNNIEFCY